MELDIKDSSSSFCKPSVNEDKKLVVYGNNPSERVYGVCVEVPSEVADQDKGYAAMLLKEFKGLNF